MILLYDGITKKCSICGKITEEGKICSGCTNRITRSLEADVSPVSGNRTLKLDLIQGKNEGKRRRHRMNYRNKEGYADPTAGKAERNVAAENRRRDLEIEKEMGQLVGTIKLITRMAGFELAGRIRLRHKETGKELE